MTLYTYILCTCLQVIAIATVIQAISTQKIELVNKLKSSVNRNFNGYRLSNTLEDKQNIIEHTITGYHALAPAQELIDKPLLDVEECPKMIRTVEQYKIAYLNGCKPSKALFKGFSDLGCFMHGRVMTKAPGAKDWDTKLSGSHPSRKVVWAVGADALSQYTYQHVHDPVRMLTELGWHKDGILSMVERGFEFQLVVWGGNDPVTGQCDKSGDLNRSTIPAAWPIAWQKVRKAYKREGVELPFITNQVLKKLHTTSFSDLTGGGCKRHGSRWRCGSTEAQNAFNEIQYGRAGLDYFLTLERPSALQVRAFLCNVLQFDTLYTGVGYTQTDDGVLSHTYNWAEYLLFDETIDSLPYSLRLPIKVTTN